MIRQRLAVTVWTLLAFGPALARAQATATPAPATHAGEIAAQQAEKARTAHPYRASWLERLVQDVEEHLTARDFRWHPFYGHAYPGAGVTFGAGYLFRPGNDDTLAIRASRSLNGSTRAELAYRAPRLARRRAALSMLGGWSEGIAQSFYGVTSRGTDTGDRSLFDFRRSYASLHLETRPRRNMIAIGGGLEVTQYQHLAKGDDGFARRFSAATLPGFGATVTYVQANGSAALDWRPERGYARRGGAWGVTARRFTDTAGDYSFTQIDYDAVQHVPVLRDAWVLSLHARAETTFAPYRHQVPFFMLPALGNGTTLRGYANQRFRDRNSMLLQAEWRVLLNAVLDLAFFYDAGKVTARPAHFGLHGLQTDYGVGLRLHSTSTTPIRVDLARGLDGVRVAFGAVATF